LPPPPPPPPLAQAPRAMRPTGRRRLPGPKPKRDRAAAKALYQKFHPRRQKAGEHTGVKFDSFQTLIAPPGPRPLSDKGAQAVDFRLETKDGKVSLKAKVVK